jgi:DNA-directed RNA polymerase subunit RPC12/RpoP
MSLNSYPFGHMSTYPDEELKAVHVCQACGTVIERSAVEAESIITGLIKCPNCGHTGDLNIEIRGISMKRPPVRATVD